MYEHSEVSRNVLSEVENPVNAFAIACPLFKNDDFKRDFCGKKGKIGINTDQVMKELNKSELLYLYT